MTLHLLELVALYPNVYNRLVKPLRFLGNSLECLRQFPEDVRHDAGYQLERIQHGKSAMDFKPMPSVGKGVEELRVWDNTGTYRVLYVARFADAVYVLHAFQKKFGRRASATSIWRERGTQNSGEGNMGKMVHSFKNVWDALADTPEQAASLRARAGLMRQITDVIEENGWTQMEAGANCGVTQPRINDLLRGRISRFSLDALVNIAAALGRPVRVELQHPKHRRQSRMRRSA